MASNAGYAAQLTPGQRWEVLALYRRERLGAKPGGNFPVEALVYVRDVFANQCTAAVLDGDLDRAGVLARQCCYAKALMWCPAARRVHRVILNRRAAGTEPYRG